MASTAKGPGKRAPPPSAGGKAGDAADDVIMEHEKLAGAAMMAHEGLLHALSSLGDVHNALARQLRQAKEEIDPLFTDMKTAMHRLNKMEDKQKKLDQELPKMLSDLAADQGQKLDQARASLKRDQDNLEQTLRSDFDGKMASSEKAQREELERQQAAMSTMEAGVDRRLQALEAASGNLTAEQNAHTKMLDRMLHDTLPQMDLHHKQRLQELTANLSQRAERQEASMRKMEESLSDHSAQLANQSDAIEACARKTALVLLDSRVGSLEDGLEKSGATMDSQVANLVKMIGDGNTELSDKLVKEIEDLRNANDEAVADVWKSMKGDVGARLDELEKDTKEAKSERHSFFDRIGKEVHGMRNDITATRDWSMRRIDDFAQSVRSVDEAHQADKKNLEEYHEHARTSEASLSKQVVELNRRQDRCTGSVEHCIQMVNNLGPTLDRLAIMVGDPNNSAATTQCLTCGVPRCMSPWTRTRSQSPDHNATHAKPLADLLSDDWSAASQVTTPHAPSPELARESSIYSRPTSARGGHARPASAKVHRDIDTDSTMSTAIVSGTPAGSAHAACRAGAASGGSTPVSAVAPSTPAVLKKTKRPNSARGRLINH